jgi:hypothetical protein
MCRACSTHDRDGKCKQNFSQETKREERGEHLGGLKCTRENNIKTGLKEIGCEGMN